MSVVAMQRIPRLVVLVALIAAAACGSKQNAQPECDNDSICGDGQVCMMGKCLARGDDRTVAIEVVPKTDSSSARTSFPAISLSSSDVIKLRADARSAVVGTIAGAPDAHVVLTTPADIPGQADLRLEAELTGFEFRLGIPKGILGKQATLWLAPTSKSPQLPPARFATMLNETVGLAFPTAAEMTPIRAVLVDSLGVPVAGYVARARVLDRLISSVATTNALGEVQLLIAPGAVPITASSNVTIEFEPPSEEFSAGLRAAGPRFVTWPFDPSAAAPTGTPPVYRLPAFAAPAPLRFEVEGMGRDPEKADIALQFRLDLLDSKDGKGVYQFEARTDGLGEVAVPLIPGTATEARKYRITIVPPPSSPFASRCVAEHPVTIVGNAGQVQYSATFTLVQRGALTGTVRGADMKPASAVNVKATFIPKNTLCDDVSSTPSVSSSTDLNGVYTMALDPGTYRLDIEPPSGAPWPRHSEDGDRAVVMTDESAVHDIVLPPGVVVVGHVLGADHVSLDAASVSIFEVLCQGDTCTGDSRVPPVLRSQTSTNAKGEFRAVLPVLPE